MRVSVLASGSKGNATFVEMDGVRVLIDAGISARRIAQGLSALSVPLSALDAILVTHEHSDHIAGLRTLLKRTTAPLYARPGTLRALPEELPGERLCALHDMTEIGPVRVSAFSIPHDAADPVGYVLSGSGRCVVATDIGHVTEEVRGAVEGADILVLEANHDVTMLRKGPYPWPLKQRILGARGHLANDEAARTLARLRRPPKRVFLAHLSETNNLPELAEQTVRGILAAGGRSCLELTLARQDEMVV
ncbi:MAG: MBL fold metallo-hydrolase [Schwartzia sp.]|nr:MBL fold metallo-hydrolase [Schwartzia sp. (in: firmicutes)]